MSQVSLFSDHNPEQDFIEYKSAKNGQLPKDLWQCVTAFSNADGGNIVFGIGPDGKHIGLTESDIDKLQRDIQSSFQNVYSFRIQPNMVVREDTLSVYIPPAPAAVRPVHVLRNAGLKEPSFQNISNTFIATIYGTAFINSEDKAWLEKFTNFRLN